MFNFYVKTVHIYIPFRKNSIFREYKTSKKIQLKSINPLFILKLQRKPQNTIYVTVYVNPAM